MTEQYEKIKEVIPNRPPLGIFERLKIASVGFAYLFGMLSDMKIVQKVHRLSVQRNESLSASFIHALTTGFRMLPTNSDRLDFAGEADVVTSVETVSPLVFKVTTKDGYVFYDWEGSKKQYSTYWFMRDKAQKFYTPLTYFAASAIYRSFTKGDCRVPGDKFLPGDGGIIVEAGAYIGLKALSFARRVGPTGRVLAIELSPDNFELLQKNVEANDAGGIVTCVNSAVWKESGSLMMRGGARMNHSVAVVDEKKPSDEYEVAARSLDALISEAGFDRVDFLNLQLNGAEVDAIEGLVEHWGKVKYLNIITRFHKDGVLIVDEARKVLEKRGAEIVVDARDGHLYNLTARLN